MSTLQRSAYVTCVVCGKSVEDRIYNKHWAHSPGHRTADQPRPPKIIPATSPTQYDDTEVDYVVLPDEPVFPLECVSTENAGTVTSEDTMNDERIHGAGT